MLMGLLLAGCCLASAKKEKSMLKDKYVKVNGVRLHYVTAGKGPLILFLHGFPEFWYEWKNQLIEFAKDHQAVAPDMRGYNLSDKPTELDQYKMATLVEDIRALGDHLSHGKKFVLVAHDWGGAVAWSFAIAHPDYLSKLVIINAPHPGVFAKLLSSDPAQQKASQYMLMFRSDGAEKMLSANDYAGLVGAVLGAGLKSGVFTEEDKQEYIKAWSQPGALTGGLNYYRANHVGPPAGKDAPFHRKFRRGSDRAHGEDSDASDLGRKRHCVAHAKSRWPRSIRSAAHHQTHPRRNALGDPRETGRSERRHPRFHPHGLTGRLRSCLRECYRAATVREPVPFYLDRNFTNNDTAIPNPIAITMRRTAVRPIRRATPAPLYPPAIAPSAMMTTNGQ